MEEILQELSTILTPEQWTGAFLGTFVSALFTALQILIVTVNKYFFGKRYSKKVLGAIADNKTQCLINLREMQNCNEDGKYKSYGPKIHPSIQQDTYDWQNIKSVLGDEDVQAIALIYNLLGGVDKTHNIALRDISQSWDDWSTPQFSIGGNYKAYELIKKCTPILVSYNDSIFEVLTSGNKYSNYDDGVSNYDVGIVYKGHLSNGKSAIVIFGNAGLATIVSTRFIQIHSKQLGKLYGKAGFAAVIKSDFKRGSDYYELVEISPKPIWYRRWRHFITYYRWRNYVKSN